VKRSAPALDVDFESIGELIPQLVWVTNSAGEAVYFNQAWYAYTGQIPVDALPDGWTNAVHPEDFGPTVAAWRSSVAFGTPFDVEYRLRDDDGRYRWFVARGQPLRALDGSIVRWFGTSTDIEDRKVAESLLRERFERDHRVLGILQSAMQPDLPRVAAVRFDALYRAADDDAEVGGDWYDAFTLRDGRLVIAIGDVTGHGLGAAVAMSETRQIMRALARTGNDDPSRLLDATDDVLRQESDGRIVTAFVGVVHPVERILRYASAGHPPPLICDAHGRIVALEGADLPLGLRDLARSEPPREIALRAGDALVLCSDGVTETTREWEADGERLREAVARVCTSDEAQPAAAIHRAVAGESIAHDDVALLVVRFDALAGAAA